MKRLPVEHLAYPWIAGLAAVVMLLRIALTIPAFNHAIDEMPHIGSAIGLYEARKHILCADHPPVARLIAGLPLVLSGVSLPEYRGETTVFKLDRANDAGAKVLYEGPLPYWSVLIRARVAMLIFPALAMLFLYLLGRTLVNPLSGMLAVIFFSTDPTLLGHGMFVCTDVPACAGFLAAIYYGVRYAASFTWRRAAGAGIAVGLAVGCKFSCLVVVPIVLIIVAERVWRARRDGDPGVRVRRIVLQSCLAAAVGFVSLWAVYLFDVGPMSNQEILGDRPEWQSLPRWVREMPIPMPSLPLGLARFAGHVREGHGSYLNGNVCERGWWYYFPEMLALKSPLAFLLAMGLAFGEWTFSTVRRRGRAWPSLPILLPPAVVMALAMAGPINIGIRHLLPMLPFLYLFICWRLTQLRPGISLLLICIAVAYIETIIVHPDYLAYHNLAAGGPSKGERYTLDSNLDWGQDVLRLSRWLRTAPEARGRAYTIRLSGGRQAPLLREMGLDPDALTAWPDGLFCINKRMRLLEGDYRWVEAYPRVATIGYSIDVYDLRPRR